MFVEDTCRAVHLVFHQGQTAVEITLFAQSIIHALGQGVK